MPLCFIPSVEKKNGGKMAKKKKNMTWDEDTDIYNQEYVEKLLEDDEISAEEEGFMMGYNSTEKID